MDKKVNLNYQIAIVFSSLTSYAADFIKSYSDNPEYKIICIYNKRVKPRSKIKIVKKIYRIGILGAIIGLSLRKYYSRSYDNIQQICSSKNIPFYEVEDFKVPENLKELFSKINLGVSLGNGYIPKSFFSIFKEGMINIHHELLPEYPGAPSVIWSLYHGKKTTGFTIHKINSKIDGGEILYKQEMPILFKNSFGETLKTTYYQLTSESLIKLHQIILNLKKNKIICATNNLSKCYTTPTFFQFLTMLKNYHKLKSE